MRSGPPTPPPTPQQGLLAMAYVDDKYPNAPDDHVALVFTGAEKDLARLYALDYAIDVAATLLDDDRVAHLREMQVLIIRIRETIGVHRSL